MLSKPRFVSGSRILVDDTLVDGFIDQRDRRVQKFRAPVLVVGCDRGAKLLDRSAQLAAVTAVDLVTFGVLTDALFC